MPELLDLPNEILDLIIAATMPDGIESLAASCKTLKSLAEHAVRRHRELKKRYTEVNFGECCFEIIGCHPLYLLRDILQNPVIRLYPKVIQFGSFWYENKGGGINGQTRDAKTELEEVLIVAAAHKERIHDTISECPFIKSDERRIWTSEILEGSYDSLFALLVTLLPNLESLTMRRHPGYKVDVMMKRINTEFINPSGNARQALTKLSKLSVRSFDHGVLESTDDLGHFAALPSLRTITGVFLRLESVSGNDTYQRYYNHRISPLTQIKMLHSVGVDGGLLNLLSGVKALQNFTYTLNPHLPLSDDAYQPHKMINELGQHAGSSLTSLNVSGRWNDNRISVSDDPQCDLRVFTKLRKLRVDHVLFDDNGVACRSTCNRKGTNCDCRAQRLVDVLPASVELLELNAWLEVERAQALLTGLSELKAERLPNLRDLGLGPPAGTEAQFIKLCKQVGMVLREVSYKW